MSSQKAMCVARAAMRVDSPRGRESYARMAFSFCMTFLGFALLRVSLRSR